MKKYQQLDTDAFEKYFGGFDHSRSVGIYLKMSNMFLESFESNLAQVEAHWLAGDGKNAKIIVHRLKGALRTVGGTALGEIFYKLEQSEGNIPHSELMKILKDHRPDMDLFVSELRDWMNYLHSSLNGTSIES